MEPMAIKSTAWEAGAAINNGNKKGRSFLVMTGL
jgi:hypothetical protein